jgi:hypothetical protein
MSRDDHFRYGLGERVAFACTEEPGESPLRATVVARMTTEYQGGAVIRKYLVAFVDSRGRQTTECWEAELSGDD